MAVKCDKCGGIIPDILPLGVLRCDCKNHTQINEDIKVGERK